MAIAPSNDKFFAALQRVEALVTRGWKSAPASLVELLHDKSTGPYVLRHLTEGLHHQYPSQSVASASRLSFANRCMLYGRDDIVRAVIEAGTPQWLKDLPADKRARMVLRGDTPSAWLSAMCCYKSGGGAHTNVLSVFSFATWPLGPHSSAFIELALDVDPKHKALDDLSHLSPEGAALVMQLLMKRRIDAAPAPAIPDVDSSAASRRRSRAV